DRAFGSLARKFEVHRKILDGLVLFLEFLGLFFGLFVFFGFVLFLRVGGNVFFIAFSLRVGLGVVLLFAFFFFFLGRFEGDGGERLAEEAGAYGPGDGFAVVGPRKVIGADICNFL